MERDGVVDLRSHLSYGHAAGVYNSINGGQNWVSANDGLVDYNVTALVVLDGVEAFISGGPDDGERVAPEVILAGTDRVALDATGVALLRTYGCKTEAARGKIFKQEQIARAVHLGLGVDSPEKIVFLTGDADSAAYSEKIRGVLLEG